MGGAISSIPKRLAFIVVREMVKLMNRLHNVKEMQDKYNANLGRTVQLHFTDIRERVNVKSGEGEMEFLTDSDIIPDMIVEMKFNPTMIDIIRGKTRAKITRGGLNKGKTVWTPYSFLAAYGAGKVKVIGDGYLTGMHFIEEILSPDSKVISGLRVKFKDVFKFQ